MQNVRIREKAEQIKWQRFLACIPVVIAVSLILAMEYTRRKHEREVWEIAIRESWNQAKTQALLDAAGIRTRNRTHCLNAGTRYRGR
jgi:hypothetical protein